MDYYGKICNREGGEIMAKTFDDIDGNTYQVDDYNAVDCDEDILTGEISGYYATNDDDYRQEVSEKVYEALKKYYK
jgi:hypothetical protein